MRDLNPPSLNFLENLKESCIKVYPNLNIEIKRDGFNVVELDGGVESS